MALLELAKSLSKTEKGISITEKTAPVSESGNLRKGLGLELTPPELIEHTSDSSSLKEEEIELKSTFLPLSESSLAKEWLSPEDEVWDEFFKNHFKEA